MTEQQLEEREVREHRGRAPRVGGRQAEIETRHRARRRPRLHALDAPAVEHQLHAVAVEAQSQLAGVTDERRFGQPPFEHRRETAQQVGQVRRAQIVRVRPPRTRELDDTAERMRAAQEPEVEQAELALRGARIGFARLAQVREHGIGDGAPRHARGDLHLPHVQARPPEPRHVLEVARGLAALALDDAHLVAHGAAGAAAAHHVAPRGRVARRGDEIPPSGVGARRREKRRVRVGGGPHAVRRLRLSHPGGESRRVEPRPAPELERHLVAELSVEPRNAVDGQQLVAARRAPGVGNVEHRAHEAATAELRARADDLRLADGHGDPAVGPRVRQQHQRRDDRLRPRVLDDQRAVGTKGRMAAADEVSRPGAHPRRRIGGVLSAQHVGVEFAEAVGISLRRAPHDETIAELAQHDSAG